MPLTDHVPTRRDIVGRASVLAVLSTAGAVAAAPAANARSPLLSLGKKLDACQAARHAFEQANKEDDYPLYDQHWELREMINAVPAMTFAELSVKARAAQYAFERDPFAECVVAGSFIELSRSLAADLLRLQQDAA